MVLPGMRTDPRTPGGMPDSGTVNPGGPIPSVPQSTRQPNMGPAAGVPDPAKIEEMFTQYTAGQITREDLINFLHSASDGQGGILGLLEGMQAQPAEGGQPTVQPPNPGSMQAEVPQPLANNTLPTQGVRPETGGELDARHQQISQLLQGYGLGPADADEMSQILNPHEAGHTRSWSDDEGLWIDQYKDSEKQQAALKSPSAGIAWDPTLTGREWDYKAGKEVTRDTGSAMREMRAQAGLGVEAGSQGAGLVQRYDAKTGKTKVEELGVSNLLSDSDRNTAQIENLKGTLGQGMFQEKAWEATPWEKLQSGWNPAGQQADAEDPWDAPPAQIIPRHVASGDIEEAGSGGAGGPTAAEIEAARLEAERLEAAAAADAMAGNQATDHPGAQFGGDGLTMHGFSSKGGDQLIYAVTDSTGHRVESFKGSGNFMYMDAEGNTFEGWEVDGKIFRSKDDLDDFQEWQDKQPTYWNGEPMEFAGFDEAGTPRGVSQHYSQFGSEIYYFKSEKDAIRFAVHRQWPNGEFIPGFEGGWPTTTPAGSPTPKGPLIGTGRTPKHNFGKSSFPTGLTLDTSGRPTAGTDFDPKTRQDSTFDDPYEFGKSADEIAGSFWDQPGASDNIVGTGAAAAAAAPAITADPLQLEQARRDFPMLDQLIKSLEIEDVNPLTNPDITQSLIGVVGTLEGLKLKGDQQAHESLITTTREALDREAVTSRANLDRAFQEGAAIGLVNDQATLAARAEENKRVFEMAQVSGYVPQADGQGGWVAGSEQQVGVERAALNISETDKTRSREIDIMTLFGQYVEPGGDVNATLRTIESEKFGLTKALQIAETTGKIPDTWAGDATITGSSADTFAMKRFTFEKDMGNRAADLQDRLARNAEQTQTTNLTIANNRNALERHIAQGQLNEAVNARKDSTWLENERIKLEKDKMKLDTLMALNNPASFLFAKRYGILDDIGDALGISWGDDVIDEIPQMLAPNTIPTLQEFQRATPSEREIMLAEMSSSGGYTSNEAVRLIIEGAPGAGPGIRRPTILGASR